MSAAVIMSARKTPSFWHGIGAALVLSLAGAALLATLTTLVGAGSALRAVVALLGLAYVLYLLGRAPERVGRITTVVLWLLVSAAAWFGNPPLAVFVLLHVGMVWLVRSLYFYSNMLAALADLGLSALAVAFAIWAASRSGSALLALWCFFLVQAFFVSIPAGAGTRAAERKGPREGEEQGGFERAQRAAEAALRRMAATRH